jgi:hypothetical protein
MGGASCGMGGTSAPDATFLFTAPSTNLYTIDTFGSAFDTVLYVRDAACDGAELACNDDSLGTRQSQVTEPLTAGQSIVIVVDGYSTASGAFRLNVSAATSPTSTPTSVPTTTATQPPVNTSTPTRTALSTSTPTSTSVATLAPTLTPTVAPSTTPTASQTPTSASPTATAPPLPPQQLVAVQDAWIDQSNVTQNKGTDTNLRVSPANAKLRRALVQFDLSSIPATACLSSATLMLKLTAVQSPGWTIAAHRLTQSWTEGTGRSNSGVTWSRRDGATSWTTAGGSFVATATAEVFTGTSNGVTLQWDVTADVAAFVAGTAPNYGWLVKDSNEGTGKESRFASRETNTANRPQLQITFVPCP